MSPSGQVRGRRRPMGAVLGHRREKRKYVNNYSFPLKSVVITWDSYGNRNRRGG